MGPEIFDRDGPYLTGVDYGCEPSLRDLIIHYYTSHGIPLISAERFAQRYIDNFFEQTNPVSDEELDEAIAQMDHVL